MHASEGRRSEGKHTHTLEYNYINRCSARISTLDYNLSNKCTVHKYNQRTTTRTLILDYYYHYCWYPVTNQQEPQLISECMIDRLLD